MNKDDIARFESKIKKATNGCWLWTDVLDGDGYGTFFLRGKNRRAHRVAWYFAHGPIPKGMIVGHKCGHRSCVNRQHLTLATPRQNALENSNSIAAVNARKTECKNGHPFDKTYTYRGGLVRYCSICQNEKMRLARKNRGPDPLQALEI